MNRFEGMKTVEGLLKNNFKYLYKKEKLNIFELHLSFQMDSDTHELQASLDFQEDWVDVLIFISPTPLEVGTKNYWQASQTVNYVNCYCKAFGRFYIDLHGDLAYSLRFKYDFLEAEPHMVIAEIQVAIEYYIDLFATLLGVCLGKISFDKARLLIDERYDELL